ncbi:uncharacterized protein LOC126742567 [Anthonomus grandis grandis]|uniref:uncharacterized protein LOC126742567 n=1 Tax=Anthonomus grandis grandis TaxID=2921223 RepID=UPI0021654FB1|nr:uncharacterized protein LOC126742567 [Anthonomus grandis grandis]
MALLISLYLLTKHKTRSSEIIEIEQQHTPYHLAKEPIGHYGYYHHGGGYGEHAQPSNLYPDVAYAASAAGVTAAGTAESPAGYPGNQDDSSNGIPLGLGRNGKEFKRRRDAYIKRKKGDNVSDSSVVVNT